MKDRGFRACQHCCERVRMLPSQTPGAPDRAFSKQGNPECLPGLLHKIMPVVGGEGEGVG
jgi:hypothetical protein